MLALGRVQHIMYVPDAVAARLDIRIDEDRRERLQRLRIVPLGMEYGKCFIGLSNTTKQEHIDEYREECGCPT